MPLCPFLGGLGIQPPLEADIIKIDMSPATRFMIDHAEEQLFADLLGPVPDDLAHFFRGFPACLADFGAVFGAECQISLGKIASADEETDLRAFQDEGWGFGNADIGIALGSAPVE